MGVAASIGSAIIGPFMEPIEEYIMRTRRGLMPLSTRSKYITLLAVTAGLLLLVTGTFKLGLHRSLNDGHVHDELRSRSVRCRGEAHGPRRWNWRACQSAQGLG